MSMKYDAGMTQYHDDIVAALRDMLHGEMDKIAELAAEGSPVPLREYLRNNHGKAIHGGNKFEAMSSCFLVPFDHVINNKGDSKLGLSWSQVTSFIRKYPAEIFNNEQNKGIECRTPSSNIKPELPPQLKEAADIADTFNYAVLSAELGDYLRHKEEQLKNEYMNFTANCGRIFAEAQEKLAKHGFGENNGIFEKWITAMGFTKPTVYRMISIYNFRSSQIETNEGQAVFDALPKTLQADISAPSAPPKLVEQVMNGDITTHKEYIELKKQLEAQMQRYSKALDENHSLHNENQSLRRDRANAMNRADEAEKRNAELEIYDDALVLKNQELEQHVKDLESQPRDVAVQTDPEAERKFSETLRKLNLDFENFRDEADRDLADMRNQRNAALDRAEAAEAKLNAPKAESSIKPFLIKMTMDDFSALIKAVENDPYLKNIIQKAQVIRI